MERYGGGSIVVCDYDPTWVALFERERTQLSNVLGSRMTAIEHVGSTSVPGLAAKPIIDLLVVVFRDYLRSHPEIAAAYGNLKKALALVFNEDIAAFRNAKNPFVQAVVAQARAEKASG